MADLLEALKKTAEDNNRYIFYGLHVTVALGLLFNFIGMGTTHWIGLGDIHFGPFHVYDNDSALKDVKSDDVILMLPVGVILVCVGDFAIYWFIRKGGEKVWLLRGGGALVHYGGLLMIIAASLWGAHAKADNSFYVKQTMLEPKLGYSFAFSVTGATLISLVGPLMPLVYRRNNAGNYISIASSTSRSSSFYSSCMTG